MRYKYKAVQRMSRKKSLAIETEMCADMGVPYIIAKHIRSGCDCDIWYKNEKCRVPEKTREKYYLTYLKLKKSLIYRIFHFF